MNTTNLFPVLVCDFDYNDHDNFKQVFFENIEKYITPFEGGTQDESGIVNLHQHKELLPFYTFVATSVKDYVRELGVDPECLGISHSQVLVECQRKIQHSGT